MLSVQLSIIKLVFRDPCVVKARFCPLDTDFEQLGPEEGSGVYSGEHLNDPQSKTIGETDFI